MKCEKKVEWEKKDKATGRRIRQLRKMHGLSQDELAEMMELTPGSLGLLERGGRGITRKRLVELNEIFKVSIDYILLGCEDSKISNNPIEYLPNILSKYELKHLAEFAKRLSLYDFNEREVGLLFEALYSQLNLLVNLTKRVEKNL